MENNWLDLRHLTKNDYETENKWFLNEKEIYDKIDIDLEKAKKNQEKFKSNLKQ